MKNLNNLKAWYKKSYVRLILLLIMTLVLYINLPYIIFLLAFLGLMPALIICIVEIALEIKPKKKGLLMKKNI